MSTPQMQGQLEPTKEEAEKMYRTMDENRGQSLCESFASNPTAKDILQEQLNKTTDHARSLEIVLAMLPTNMTSVQSKALKDVIRNSFFV